MEKGFMSCSYIMVDGLDFFLPLLINRIFSMEYFKRNTQTYNGVISEKYPNLMSQ
jgi:hypothetical protein